MGGYLDLEGGEPRRSNFWLQRLLKGTSVTGPQIPTIAKSSGQHVSLAATFYLQIIRLRCVNVPTA